MRRSTSQLSQVATANRITLRTPSSMPNPTTIHDLLQLLEQSSLLEPKLYARIADQAREAALKDPANQSPQRLAQSLIKSQVITVYQARQLLGGRPYGFYIGGKYKFLDLLGVGGMGKVFLAEQISMQRLVAVKIVRFNSIKAERQKEVLARFTREARAVAQLQHANIIRAYDFDQEDGIPYIVMEYVEGIDSAQQVLTFGRLTQGQAAEYGRQAAAALQCAHDAGLVHRDVKPQNLLVSISGEVKLLDLGLVAVFDGTQDHSLTVAENQLGTIDYIAPEQAVDSHKVDARADIYSLGATIYTLIVGNVLFPNRSTAQKLLAIQTQDPTPLRELSPAVTPEFAALIHRMLSRNLAERPQTMAEVQALLEPFAVPAKPPYDPGAVKFPAAQFEPFMGRSPEGSSLNLVSITKVKADGTGGGGSSSTRKANGSGTEINRKKALPKADEDDFLNDLASVSAMALPPAKRKRQSDTHPARRGAAKAVAKKDETVTNILNLLIGLVAILALVAGVVVTTLTASKPSRTPEVVPIGREEKEGVLSPEASGPSEAGGREEAGGSREDAGGGNREGAANNRGKGRQNNKLGGNANGPKVAAQTNPTPPVSAQSTSPDNNRNHEIDPVPAPTPPAVVDTPAAAPPGPEPRPGGTIAATPTTPGVVSTDPAPAAPGGRPVPEMASKPKPGNRKGKGNPTNPPPAEEPDDPNVAPGTMGRWKGFLDERRTSPDMLFLQVFAKQPTNKKNPLLPNEVGNPLPLDTALRPLGFGWAEGRWPGKGAAVFGDHNNDSYGEIPLPSFKDSGWTNGQSISLWFRCVILERGDQMLAHHSAAYWRLQLDVSGRLQLSVNRAGSKNERTVTGEQVVNDGRWHLVTITEQPGATSDDPVTWSLWVDRQQDAQLAAPHNPANQVTPVGLGNHYDRERKLPFTGLIDEVQIWTKPLSADEIRENYRLGVPEKMSLVQP